MELKKIKGYIVGFAIGTTLGLTAFTNGGSFTGITSMTQTWFNAIQTKLDGTYVAGNMCTSDGSGQIQCITAIPTAGSSLPQNSQTFTANGTFTVPVGVTQVLVYIAPAAGGGSGGNSTVAGFGGGASSFLSPVVLNVTSGQVISVTIGVGGSGGVGVYNSSGTAGGNGGTTSFGTISRIGGLGGAAGSNSNGGSTGGMLQLPRGGTGGVGEANNGTNGTARAGLTGGNGGKGGDGKVIVYW